MVWICSGKRNESRATILDATDPQTAVESFTVCRSIVLCVSSVPGATESDYADQADGPKVGNVDDEDCESPLGRINFVQNDENVLEPGEDFGGLCFLFGYFHLKHSE